MHVINTYVYMVDALRNGQLMEARTSRFKFYNDGSLDGTAVMPHTISSETVMQVQRFVNFVEQKGGSKD